MTREEAIILIKENIFNIKNIPDNLKVDKKVLLAAIDEKPLMVFYILFNAFQWNYFVGRNKIIGLIKKNAINLDDLPYIFRNDKVLALKMVEKDPIALRHVSDELKNDRRVALTAISKDSKVLEFVGDVLKNDKEVVLAAINRGYENFKFAGDGLLNNQEFIEAAIKSDGRIYGYLNEVQQMNKQLIKLANASLSIIGKTVDDYLCYGLIELKKNYSADTLEVALKRVNEVLSKDPLSYFLTATELPEKHRGNKDRVLMAVRKRGQLLKYVRSELRGDKEVVMAAVKKFGMALQYASDELRADKEVVMTALKEYGGSLRFASDELKNDKEVVIAAIKDDGEAYQYCVKEMQVDSDVILLANKKLLGSGQTIDDFLCDELIKFKKEYGVETIELALEIESAKLEVEKSLGCKNIKDVSIIKNRF